MLIMNKIIHPIFIRTIAIFLWEAFVYILLILLFVNDQSTFLM